MNTTTSPGTQPDSDITQAARKLGSMRTEAKAKASRLNGRKGGRPVGTPQSEETRRKIKEGNIRAKRRPKE